MGKVARNSIIVAIFNLCGTGLVLLSNIIIAYKFGAGREMDIYFASTALPFFIMTILSMTVSFIFIPVFTEYEKKNEDNKWEIMSSFINSCLIVTVLLCITGVIFSKNIVSVIMPGFGPAKIEKAAILLRILFPVIILSILNELIASVYYAHNRFVIPSLNKILHPVVTILFVLLFSSFLSTKSIVLATLCAFFIQSLFLAIGFIKHKDFNYGFTINFRHPKVIRIFKLMAPLMAAMLITKAIPVIDRFFLSRLQEGSISHVTYAYRITLRLAATAASGLIIVLFPVMATHAATLDYDKIRYYMAKGIKMLFFITIPFVAMFILYGKPIVGFVFERGKFTSIDTVATFKAGALYLLALPAVMIKDVFYKGFYSIKKYKIAAIISTSITFLYIALCFILLKFLNYLAIPVAYAISFYIDSIVSGVVVRRCLRTSTNYRIMPEVMKNTASAALVVLCMWPVIGFVKHRPIPYFLVCGLGFLVYFVLSKNVFHIEAAKIMWGHMLNYKNFFK